MITIFKGDDTGGALGKHIFLDIQTQYDLTGCTVIFNYQGIERRLTDVRDGDRREIIFSHNETAKMAVGTFKAVVIAVDSSGKIRTLTNTLPIKVSTDLADSYDENIAFVRIGKTISWANIGNLPFEGQEVDISTDDRVLAALGTIIEKLGGTVKASIALLALCAATAFGYTPEAHTNSYERDGVTYAQRGGMGAATYVVTNIADRAGDARVLPKYLHFIQTDDTYPADAKWYYDQPRDYGHCSSVKDGDYLYRNFDMFLDDRAEFVVSVSGNGERFASVGVANCGTNLTERFVSTHKPSRYYKALAGSVVDGINENGVAININLVDGVPQWRNQNGDIHPLEAVRWSLDHGTNALEVAIALATRIRFPVGWTQNFHWMVCDADHCYIVENGEAHGLSGRTVMTNFRLYPQVRGTGWERYQLLTSGANIMNVWYTKAYSRNTDWPSEFKDAQEMEAAKQAWETHTKEQLRGHGLWQSVHTSCYDLRRKTLKICVQETDDWYVFAVPEKGTVKSVNGKTGEVVLGAADVDAVPNDADYQSVRSKATTAVQPAAIADMETKTHAAETYQPKGDYLTEEEDPTVKDWAKADTKPSYTPSEVGALPDNQAQLETNENFRGAVATVSPPVELPSKWALANVTNAYGGAVAATNINAMPLVNHIPDVMSGSEVNAEKWHLTLSDTVSGLTSSMFGGLSVTSRDENGRIATLVIDPWSIFSQGLNCKWSDIALKTNVLSKADAQTFYLSKADANTDYLKKTDASTTYLSKSDANTTYLKKEDAQTTYEEKDDATAKLAEAKAYSDAGIATVTAELGNKRDIDDLDIYEAGYDFAAKSGVDGEYTVRADDFNGYRITIMLNGDDVGKTEQHQSYEAALAVIENHQQMTLWRGIGDWEDVPEGTVFEWVKRKVDEIATTSRTVPVTRKINGVPLTQDITVQGMPTTGLVWNATAGNVKTADGAKTIGAEDVGALKKLTETSQQGESVSLTVEKNYYPNEPHTEYDDILYGCPSLVSDYVSGDRRTITTLDYGGLYQREYMYGYSGWGQTAMYGIAFGTSAGGLYLSGYGNDAVQFSLQVRDGTYGYLATENWTSLRTMLADANTDPTADCECISTNICKLIAPHIEPVKVLLNIYDNELEANWAFSIVNGDMKYACTTNEDITAFQKANPVLTDKQTADDYRVIVTGGEMKFFTDQQ